MQADTENVHEYTDHIKKSYTLTLAPCIQGATTSLPLKETSEITNHMAMNSSPVSESDFQLLSLNQESLTSDKQCKIRDMGCNTGVISTSVL